MTSRWMRAQQKQGDEFCYQVDVIEQGRDIAWKDPLSGAVNPRQIEMMKSKFLSVLEEHGEVMLWEKHNEIHLCQW